MRIKKIKSKMDRNDFIEDLKKEGFKRIGCGAFAQVLARPRDKVVIKVGCGEDAYLNYVKSIGLNAKNPLFPRVKKIAIHTHRDTWGDNSFYVAHLERLIPYSKKIPNRRKIMKRLGLRSIYDIDYDLHDLKLKSPNKNMKLACRKLISLTYIDNLDIHEGNLMWRKRGRGHQLVITDPLS